MPDGGSAPSGNLVAGAIEAVTGNGASEAGDVCAALRQIKWEAEDADHVSGTLAGSLDYVLEAEKEHGCR